jgi:hypothetical protein
MLKFTIKRGDTSPALRFALLPDSVSLAGAVVRFQPGRAGPCRRGNRSAARRCADRQLAGRLRRAQGAGEEVSVTESSIF